MQPSDPEDLIRRPQVNDKADSADPAPLVRLERYQQLEHLIRELPLHVDPYLELAEIYMQAHRWVDARRVLEKAVERFPEDQQVTFLLEESQLARSQQLLELTEREVAVEPTPLTQKKLDDCKIELNGLRARIFRSRLQRNPDQLELLIPLAGALRQLGRIQEAIEVLQRAAAVPPFRAQASYQLGTLLEETGDVPAALSAYRRAALFRVPPPEMGLKIKALEAAAELSHRKQLFHSAVRYLKLLQDLRPNDQSCAERLNKLESRV